MTPEKTKELAHHLFQKYSLTGWTFKLNRAKTYYGICRFDDEVIELSRYFVELESDENIRMVLLHEIAHALSPGDGHGKKWAAKCIELGIEPKIKLSLCEMPSSYITRCSLCDTKYTRNRKAKTKLYCCLCGNKKQLKWRKV